MERNTNNFILSPAGTQPQGARRDSRRRPAGRPHAGREEIGVTSDRLPARAVRLLQALAEPGTHGLLDAVDETRIVLCRAGTRGISVSGGAHPRDLAERLVAAELAAWDEPDDRRPRLRITPVGEAHLRRGDDPEAAFAAQHRLTTRLRLPDPRGGGARPVSVNQLESPLAWLAARKTRDGNPVIDPASFEAGERFRRDLTLAGSIPGISVDWSRLGGGATAGFSGERQNATEVMVAARQRVERACVALGQEDADLLIDLCGFLKGLSTIERERGWPARSAKMLVVRALRRLAEHYGLAAEARGRDAAKRILVWRDGAG